MGKGFKSLRTRGPGPPTDPEDNNGGVENQQAGGAENLDPGVRPRQLDALSCDVCGKEYVTKSGLARHKKTCGVRDREHCLHCGLSFGTFAGVRQHERKKHPREFMAEAEAELPPSNARVYTLMAEIEVEKRPNQPFLRAMADATGLTVDQVRYRRGLPAYTTFLKDYRRETALKETPNLPRASTSRGKRRRVADFHERVRTELPEIASLVEPNDRLEVPMSPDARGRIDGNATSSADAEQCQPSSSGVGRVPGPTRRRPSTSSSLSSDSEDSKEALPEERYPHSTLPPNIKGKTPLRPRGATVKCTKPPLTTMDEPVSQDKPFRDHLEGLRDGAPSLSGIIDAAISSQPEHLLGLIDDWLKANLPGQRRGRRGGRKHDGSRNYGQTTGGRGPRAAAFKKTQDLWQKSRSVLADAVLSGRVGVESEEWPTVEAVEELYGGIFESASPQDREPTHGTICRESAFAPITVEEVEAAKRGWKDSAPGPDGIGVAGVRAHSDVDLATLFTIILWRGVQPTSWRTSRTVLIYKEGNRENPTNWRPITIGSAVQRLLHRVLSRRLRQVLALNLNQRGFVGVDGTAANAMILDCFIRSRTEQGRPFSVVSLDIRKAFDTVSHYSIERAMGRFGIDVGLVRYIMGSLTNTTTTIQVGRAYTRELVIRRGVKQGDPLSPLLFNLVVDELLHELNGAVDRGARLADGAHFAAMAFADDLIVVDEMEERVPASLSRVERFLRARGMQVNPQKSVSLCVAGYEGRSVPRTRPTFRLGEEWLRPVGVVDSFRYLGHRVGFGGIERPTLYALQVMLDRTHKAPLKPHQKLYLLKQHVVPRLLYGYQVPKVSVEFLRDADRLVRRFVKRALHLPSHTPTALIHSRMRDGGLGVLSLRTSIPYIYGGRLRRLSEVEDPVISAALNSEKYKHLRARLSQLSGPSTPDHLWRQEMRSGEMTSGLLNAVGDSASSAWLGDKPMGWTGRDFVRAVQLRTETLPVVGVPSNPIEARRCRGCRLRVESLSHVLQRCPVVHGLRIRRHDEVCRKVARFAEGKGWVVEWEPHLRHPDGTLFKPDLAIHMDTQIVIVDVQISWETTTRPMLEVWDAKRLVYDNPRFREAAARRWPGRDLLFTPLILGARGFWPRCNQPVEDALVLTKSLKASCVHTVLKWGSSLHLAFMRAVWT